MNILNSNKIRMINRERLIKRKIAYYNKLQQEYVKMFSERFKNFPPLIVPKYTKNGDVDDVIYIQSPMDMSTNMTCIVQLKERE